MILFLLGCLLLPPLLVGCGAGTEGTPPPASAGAEELAVEKERGPVKVRLVLAPKNPTLSSDIRFSVIIDAAQDVKLERPAMRPVLGEFVIRDFRHRLPRLVEGRQILQSDFTLEALRTGPHLVRPLDVKFHLAREKEEKEHVLTTDPLKVEVVSIVGDERPDLGALKGPRGLVEVALPGPAIPWFWLVAAGVAMAAALALWWIWRRRRARIRPERVLSPKELAYLELQELLRADLVAAGELGEFFLRLTLVVRRYIERTTGVHAPEQTTEEFLREMRNRDLFAPERQAGLAHFLEAADLVKFAAHRPGATEVEQAFSAAKAFVDLEEAA